jgi:hypothetical protein
MKNQNTNEEEEDEKFILEELKSIKITDKSILKSICIFKLFINTFVINGIIIFFKSLTKSKLNEIVDQKLDEENYNKIIQYKNEANDCFNKGYLQKNKKGNMKNR